jgi:hypothetical protein
LSGRYIQYLRDQKGYESDKVSESDDQRLWSGTQGQDQRRNSEKGTDLLTEKSRHKIWALWKIPRTGRQRRILARNKTWPIRSRQVNWYPQLPKEDKGCHSHWTVSVDNVVRRLGSSSTPLIRTSRISFKGWSAVPVTPTKSDASHCAFCRWIWILRESSLDYVEWWGIALSFARWVDFLRIKT